jgi:hypothetical protein
MKQKLIYVFMSLLFITSCSVNREEPLVIQGIDGVNSYVTWEVLPENSPECEAGGIKLIFGNDASDETTETNICNGVDGENGEDGADGKDGVSLGFYVEAVDGTEEYPNGGINLYIGVDDGDGTLDTTELENAQVFFVPNGNDGADGQDGADGIDGYNTATYSEPYEGENGVGTIVYTGLDVNRNNELDEGERSGFYVVLNGEQGIQGIQGEQGLQGEQGIQGEQGVPGVQGPKGDQGIEGPAGPKGDAGQDGQDGQDAYQIRSFSINWFNNSTKVVFYQDVNGNEFYDLFVDNVVNTFIVKNGEDGEDGEDGTDGQDGQDGADGLTPVITYEEVDGGTKVIITIGETVTTFIVADGEKGEQGEQGLPGQDGADGADGEDGEDGADGVCPECDLEDDCEDGKVTICHKKGNTYETLELTFAEYVYHIYEEHNGNSTQNDSFGPCYEEKRLAVKDPNNQYGEGEAGREWYKPYPWSGGYWRDCHYNYSTVVVYNEADYKFWTEDYVYADRTFELPDNKEADDYDCDSTPNL